MLNQTNQSYLGNPNVKRDGVQQAWTPELLKEYKIRPDDSRIWVIKRI